MKVSAKTSFERKLVELERAVKQLKQGDYPTEYFPDNVSGFRAWERVGVFDAWVNKTVDAPNGSYPKMAEELRA